MDTTNRRRFYMHKKIIRINSGTNNRDFINQLEKDVWESLTSGERCLLNKTGEKAMEKFFRKYPELRGTWTYTVLRDLVRGNHAIVPENVIAKIKQEMILQPEINKLESQVFQIIRSRVKK
jgi:hypothetical protein